MSQHFLYSMSEFMPLVRQLLPERDGFSLTEIGSELGTMTRALMDLVDEGRLRDYVIVEPYPSPTLLEMAEGRRFRLVEALSVDALAKEPVTDVYLVDGDHNYHTVVRETRLILEGAVREGKLPLVVYHDVAWPCGDRDAYYAPEVIPPGERRPHTHHLGPVPGQPGVSATGWRSAGVMAFALEAGGPANGIRTAIQDALQDHPDWEFHLVPCILGLGVLFPRTHPEGERLRRVLAPFEGNFLLEKLEENRLRLIMEIQEMEDLRDASRAASTEQTLATSMPLPASCRDLTLCLADADPGTLQADWLLPPRERMAEVWRRLRKEGELSCFVPLETFARLRGSWETPAENAYVALAALVRDPAACARIERRVLAGLHHREEAPASCYGSTSYLGREQLLLQAPLLSEHRREEARAACTLLQDLPVDPFTINPIPSDGVRHLPPVLFRFAAWCVEEARRMGVGHLSVLPDRLELLASLLAQEIEAGGLAITVGPPRWTERDLHLVMLTDYKEEGLGRLGRSNLANGVAGAADLLGLSPDELPKAWRDRFAVADPRLVRLALLEAVTSSELLPRIEAGSLAARERLLAAGPFEAVVGLGWGGDSVDALNRLLGACGRPERCQGLFLDPPGSTLASRDLWERFEVDSPLLASLWRTPEAQGPPSHKQRLRTGLLDFHRQWVQS